MNDRRMDGKLKTGFTTGTSAAAAAKAALLALLEKKRPEKVRVILLTGEPITISVYGCMWIDDRSASCTVIKDAGDDPDVTNGAEIGAVVTLLDETGRKEPVEITGGKGVGTITKPGLELSPGEPAINQGPRKMILQSIKEVLEQHRIAEPVRVEIFVPEGERLAQKTLNARLGIVGGISILGTTGVVKPLSHSAYVATIDSSMSVAKAAGVKTLILTTGRRSERFSQALWPQFPEEAFIQIGDFFKVSLELAARHAFKSIILAVFFGKAIKMAQGVPHTHAGVSSLTLQRLGQWSEEFTKDAAFAAAVSGANTARGAFELIQERYPKIIGEVGQRIVGWARKYSAPDVHVRSVIFDYSGKVVFDSNETGCDHWNGAFCQGSYRRAS
ncbi:MAG: cobalt-precorrin-5B (C(1))-methyltransferase [Deltaproteobacteria bacterium]|nr:cobalt-precorrin-5B (C(1))-methyltransferase [Deltaproteobacteria bacterium]